MGGVHWRDHVDTVHNLLEYGSSLINTMPQPTTLDVLSQCMLRFICASAPAPMACSTALRPQWGIHSHSFTNVHTYTPDLDRVIVPSGWQLGKEQFYATSFTQKREATTLLDLLPPPSPLGKRPLGLR